MGAAALCSELTVVNCQAQPCFGSTPFKAPNTGERDCETSVSEDLKRELIALLPRLRRFAMTLTRTAADADDIVQEACLKALSKSDQWDPNQPADRWVFRIMRNHWISETRKRNVRVGEGVVAADETTELVHHETPEDTLAGVELNNQINALPSELSTILLAVSVEGYTYAEAADLLDMPIGTVMSRIHRARKILAARLSANQEDSL